MIPFISLYVIPKQNYLGYVGYCFFPLFSISKNSILFLRLKTLFDNPKWIENKKYSQNSIFEEN